MDSHGGNQEVPSDKIVNELLSYWWKKLIGCASEKTNPMSPKK